MNRGGLVGDVLSTLGIVITKWWVFRSQRRKGNQQNSQLRLSEGKVWPVYECGYQSPLGGSPEEQRGPRRMDIHHEILNWSRPSLHTKRPACGGNKTGLDEQRALAETQGEKKKRFSLGRKGKQCRRTTRIPLAYAGKKLERPKGHLELHLASAIKDSNKCFYKYISYKRRAKGNLIFNGCWGTQRQRLRKCLRYLIPSLPQTLISRPAVVWVPTHLSWKNWSFTWQ